MLRLAGWLDAVNLPDFPVPAIISCLLWSAGPWPADRDACAGLCSDSRRRHLAITSWLPESSTSGTSSPLNSGGRVYWGYSSSPSRKRVVCGRFIAAEHARNQAGNSVHDDHGCDFSAGQDKIADGDFIVNEEFPDPFVDPFVATADDDQFLFPGQFGGQWLIEGLPLGGGQDNPAQPGAAA